MEGELKKIIAELALEADQPASVNHGVQYVGKRLLLSSSDCSAMAI